MGSSNPQKEAQRFDRTKKKIERLLDSFKVKLWLGSWRVTSEYFIHGFKDPGVAAECEASWQYKTAHIKFSIPIVSFYDEESLRLVIIHEMLHAVINEMRDWHINHEERVVTHLTSIINWYEENLQMMAKAALSLSKPKKKKNVKQS